MRRTGCGVGAAKSIPGHSVKLGFLWVGCDMACLWRVPRRELEYWRKAVNEGVAQLWLSGWLEERSRLFFLGCVSEALGPLECPGPEG